MKNYVDNPFKSPAILSFCPGILGIERGLKRAGIDPRVMAYMEIEAFIIANLVAGMEAGLLDPTPIWTDAKTFDARPFRGKIHGIIGGYPCPGESLAGLREGHLYKGFIWPAIRRAIAAARPLWCFFENVDDHLTGTYPIVQRSLRNMGYRTEAGIYSAEEVGATHERQRIFILAVADSDYYGYGTRTGQTIGKGSKNESKAQREEWCELLRQWMRDVIRDSGKELAIPTCELRNRTGDSETRRHEYSDSSKESGDINDDSNQWPARPGQEQYEWEEPRAVIKREAARLLGGYGKKYPESFSKWQIEQITFDGFTGKIKPSLDSTINGYNFREDILRALGNSVVEQTAELAFGDLMKKHLKNLK